MKELTPYTITKSSSDGSFKVGDIIWLSKNGDLNNAMGGGWLSKEEWDREGTNDFEYGPCTTHCLEMIGNSEHIRKISQK